MGEADAIRERQLQKAKQELEVQEEEKKVSQERKQREAVVVETVQKGEEMRDVLEEVCEYLKKEHGLGGVYVSEVTSQYKDTVDTQNIDEFSHIDTERSKALRYIGTDKEHAFMLRQVLDFESTGVTGDLLKPAEAEEEEQEQK